jgi:uncharacterized protein
MAALAACWQQIAPPSYATPRCNLFTVIWRIIYSTPHTRRVGGQPRSIQHPGPVLLPAVKAALLSIQVHEVNINQADAIAKIRSGEIAGTVLFSGKPVGLFSHISRDDNLHLLAISFTPTLENTYAPAELEAEAYPGLIPQGQTVHTIGVDAVLITNNWPKTNEKYRRAAKFVEAFFSKFSDFRKPPRHPKWLQVNLAADLPGWQRFPAAQEWLERANQIKTTQVQGQFEQFLSGVQRPGTPPLPDEAKQQLFRKFLEWSARQQQ